MWNFLWHTDEYGVVVKCRFEVFYGTRGKERRRGDQHSGKAAGKLDLKFPFVDSVAVQPVNRRVEIE